MLEDKPGPKMTIKTGPRATFGMALKITRYGSNIFESLGDAHKMAARSAPSNVPRTNPIIVSNTVTPIWLKIVPS